MAHLWWISENEWHPVPLTGDLFALPRSAPPEPLAAIDHDADDRSLIALRRIDGTGDDGWLLLAGADAHVIINGIPTDHAIVVLADRDEIRRPSAPPMFFSTERLARVATFPAAGPRGFCPRCKQAIAAGDRAVRCPGCGLWHHSSDALPCWTYDEHCAACPQPTAPDAGFQWTPEEL